MRRDADVIGPLAMRMATAADLPAVVALTVAAYAAYGDVLDAPPVPVTTDYVPRIAAGGVWLLNDGAGPPAGLIVLERHPDHLLIFSVVVAPACQGQGLGRRLLTWVEAQARAAGLARVRLYTNAKMTRNIALYTHCGYRETGRRENPARPGWIAVDMAKTLDGPDA
jgi:ribosomal protein S18 acetylase RimI-like enzyme